MSTYRELLYNENPSHISSCHSMQTGGASANFDIDTDFDVEFFEALGGALDAIGTYKEQISIVDIRAPFSASQVRSVTAPAKGAAVAGTVAPVVTATGGTPESKFTVKTIGGLDDISDSGSDSESDKESDDSKGDEEPIDDGDTESDYDAADEKIAGGDEGLEEFSVLTKW